jgi:hypothetical protein
MSITNELFLMIALQQKNTTVVCQFIMIKSQMNNLINSVSSDNFFVMAMASIPLSDPQQLLFAEFGGVRLEESDSQNVKNLLNNVYNSIVLYTRQLCTNIRPPRQTMSNRFFHFFCS